jgi:hypothetical protein
VRSFNCVCGARVFFDNTRCLSCKRELGFLPDRLVLSAFEPSDGRRVTTPFGPYAKCENYAEHGVCNWLVPEAEMSTLCQACRLNRVIPDLSNPENHRLWAEVEQAKRSLVYGLNRLRLPLASKADEPEHGLAFDIKADTEGERVLTGHADGLITLNLGEADAATREKMRVSMQERYRTLLGHFRHEVGHYYFRLLVENGGPIDDFRALFGDERADYAEALKAHYAKQATPNPAFISAYAEAHPWEDFAETFAHYLHMIDTLETAHHLGVTLGLRGKPADGSDLDALLVEWSDLAIALNMLNRSMGLPDAYPFAITEPVRAKLGFVHRLVREHGNPRAAVKA